MREEEIAREHADGVSPDAPRGDLAAPRVRVVDDVVVEERREVHELRDHREISRAVGRRAVASPKARGREEHAHRADALAPSLEQVRCGFRRGREPVGRGHLELPLDVREVVTEERPELDEPRGRALPDALGDGDLSELFSGERGVQWLPFG